MERKYKLEKRVGRKLSDFEKFIKNEWQKYHKNKDALLILRKHIFGADFVHGYYLTYEMVKDLSIYGSNFSPLCIHYKESVGITDYNREILKKILNKWENEAN